MSKTNRRGTWVLRTLAAATLGVGGFAPQVLGTNFNWTGDSTNGPFWNDPENWAPGAIPGAGDAATVANTSQPFLGTNQSVATLTLSNSSISGFHDGSDRLTAISALNLTGGAGTSTRILNYTLSNQGSGSWNGGSIQTSQVATLVNSGTMSLLSDDNLIDIFGAAATIQNSGLFIKSAGTGTSVLQASLQNQSAGVIEADSGTLQFTTGTSSSLSIGTFFSNGGVVRLDSQNIASGATFRGGINVLGISNSLFGGLVSSGTLQIVSFDNLLSGTFAVGSVGRFELATSGQLKGNGVIAASPVLGAGTFIWSGGEMRGGDDPDVITCSIPMAITGSDAKLLNTGHFVNAGNSSWDGTGDVHTAAGPTFGNPGTLDLRSDASMIDIFSQYALLNNSGTFKKTAGTGTSLIQADLQNTGIIQADSGTLLMQGNTSVSFSSGKFISNGGIVRLTNQILNTGASFGGTGTSQIDLGNVVAGSISIGAGTTQVVGAQNAVNGTLSITGGATFEVATPGALSGSGSITGAGIFRWTGGSLIGDVLTSSAPMRITGDNAKLLDTGHFVNAGNSIWDGNGDIHTSAGPTFGNSGTLDLRSDASMVDIFGQYALIANSGTFKKTVGTGTSLIQADLQNTGTIQADSGTLLIQGNTSISFSSGKFISNSGTVRLTNQILNTGASFGGTGTSQIDLNNVVAGSIAISAGTTQVVGAQNSVSGRINTAAPAVFELSAGANLAGNGTIQGAGTFRFTAGQLRGATDAGQTLTSTAPMVIDGTGVKTLDTGSFTNAGNAVWNNGDIQTFFGPTWNNSGTLDLRSDNSLFPATGVIMTFNNSGTLKKSAGTGTSALTAALSNTGTISIDSGTLAFNGDFSTTGTFTVGPSGHVAFAGGVVTLAGVQNWPPGYVLNQNSATNLNSDAGHAGANLDLEQTVGALTINSTQHLAALRVSNAQATISAGGNKLVSTRSLSVTNFGTLDVNDHAVLVNYDAVSPLATLQPQIVSAYHGGDWSGNGGFAGTITSNSAAAAASSAHPTALGYGEASALGISSFAGESVDSTTFIMRYTYSGDANLDGLVNALDFNALAVNFGASSKLWTDADFNYDNIINTLDFNALAMNFNQPLFASPALGTLVPEPASLFLLLLPLLHCRLRRQ